MSVDPYSNCPCGSGKKLKFCCTDLYADLEKVQRMIEGDQPRAAIKHIEQTLERDPGRGSLLDLKATLELSLKDFDEASKTIDRFLEADPQNPAAHAQRAILAATNGDVDGAVDHLQHAMQQVTDSLPARVLQAIGAVGQALLISGNLIAARAHLWLYQGIAGEEDTTAMQMILRLNRVAGVPLLLRDHLYLRLLPEGHPAEAAHDNAQMLASRGQWKRAAEELQSLVDQHGDQPELQYNHAVVQGWLGRTEPFAAGLQKFAELAAADPSSRDDAIEAMALAQLVGSSLQEEPGEVRQTIFAVSDEESLLDRLARDSKTEAQNVDPSQHRQEEGPPPRCIYLLLDREQLAPGAEITADLVPRVAGLVSYYGRQTDREPRLEYVADVDDHHDDLIALLRDLCGESLGDVIEEKRVGDSAADPLLGPRWRFPIDATPTQRRELMSAERRTAILERWPSRPLQSLGGKSPAEATEDAPQAIALAAALLNLEQAASRHVEPELLAELRAQLKILDPERIEPASVDLMTLPLVRVPRLELGKVSDDELGKLHERAVMAGADDALLLICEEAIDRPGLSDILPREELYYSLVSLQQDPQQALTWVDRARQAAEELGKSSATWDILELELRVVSGEVDEANRLVQHLRQEHLNEPGVAEQLYQVLYSLGAAPEPGAAAIDPAAVEASADRSVGAQQEPSAPSALWTPDSDSPQSEGGKKIWTPT